MYHLNARIYSSKVQKIVIYSPHLNRRRDIDTIFEHAAIDKRFIFQMVYNIKGSNVTSIKFYLLPNV
jgi:hypothetical protein